MGLRCASFSTGAPASGDGGTDERDASAVLDPDAGGEIVEVRDIVIVPDWPSDVALDPRASYREIVVKVEGSAKTFATGDAGPWRFPTTPIPARGLAIEIEVNGASQRLVGYGARRRARPDASSEIGVAVRKRLVYFTSGDRGGGQLRVLDGAPLTSPEPDLAELDVTLPSLHAPAGLFATADGRSIVQAGETNGKGAVAVMSTATHRVDTPIELPAFPSHIAPLGVDGLAAIVVSEDFGQTALLLVDLQTRAVREVATGFVGGRYEWSAIAASPLTGQVAVVVTYAGSPLLIVVDPPATVAPAIIPLKDLMNGVRAVKYSFDGTKLVVAGFNDEVTWSTGRLAVFSATSPDVKTAHVVSMANGKTKPTALVLSPDGRAAMVGNETFYTTPPNCCSEPRLVDLSSGGEVWAGKQTGAGPDYEILSAIRFPYAPNRVLGGQSDNGNNVNGAFVWLDGFGGAPTKAEYGPANDIGSVEALASPFATPL